ncbi:Amino acid/amide ABC transporter membrane protein 2, HAAT family [Bosea sp. 62]|uniref:branched-chain amino acid ABC transporter permease n=1 Tax=unclassified Bosea (in: a-proteobacteria) TaxID=2653178 RepID=UPI001258B146|nr:MULTISPECIES: branched-chain amino acid ABC transporter permease [unclassified Bosea (in: a-proteobacteria)]CAD5256600.1 Amino acid/amide ABC transporter membrane protein 2, HAAT family [Bosea sp. 46]CAD5260901.1 Amino acid/amide ABC transporter membrane protein 2, HAAT family [Bosea sp. 21B]CAD5279743.1 Amino acid/amide ABC transporter membrane protein 2, HAAT family [Bosea sp. 7B]VVT58355.1 Amino acid/amide ABC transporter membrane protein 2, HAAT family [Bosea sp. EC-HK365B]VXB51803.1 Am
MRLTLRTMAILLGLALFLAVPPAADASGSPALLGLANRILIYAIAAVSLDLIIGYGAMVSFGHAMFFGLGGYTVGIVAHHTFGGDPLFGWSGTNAALIVWPLALLVCALIALVVGALALRTSGVQFIMITLAFAQMVFFVLVSLQIYGGDDGLMLERRNQLPLIDLARPQTFYYLCLALLVAWTAICASIVNSRFGLVLQALRQSERRAINLGIRPFPFRLAAFVISAVGTGLAGVLWANYARFVTPDMAAWSKSGEFMAIVVLGGLGTLLGPIAGTAVFIALEQLLSTWTEHWMIVMGPVLTLVALFGRRGIAGRLFGGRRD